MVLCFGFGVRIKCFLCLFVFLTAKFNKGYKFLKFCRSRFSTKEEREGTASNTFAERKKLQREPRLSAPFAVPALVRAGLGQDWQVLGEAGGCELRGDPGLFCVCGTKTPSFVSSEPRCSQSSRSWQLKSLLSHPFSRILMT